MDSSREVLQSFSESGEPLTGGLLRGRAHAENLLHGASHIYLYRCRNGTLEVLLQRRSRDKDSFPGCLDTSSAGHVPLGQSFFQTALRELEEELGVHAPAEALQPAFFQRIREKSVFYGKPFFDNEVVQVYFLELDREPSAFRLQREEVESVEWIGLEALHDRIRSGDPEVCILPAEFERVYAALRALASAGQQGRLPAAEKAFAGTEPFPPCGAPAQPK